ncbi:hypothetical protein EG329_007623 [Mollisiaceae sp. DMI_Dod_QoI]|nr:hypothetical protein EG329_007623 [Helotiales sp. DMI_Dod_QoI]
MSRFLQCGADADADADCSLVLVLALLLLLPSRRPLPRGQMSSGGPGGPGGTANGTPGASNSSATVSLNAITSGYDPETTVLQSSPLDPTPSRLSRPTLPLSPSPQACGLWFVVHEVLPSDATALALQASQASQASPASPNSAFPITIVPSQYRSSLEKHPISALSPAYIVHPRAPSPFLHPSIDSAPAAVTGSSHDDLGIRLGEEDRPTNLTTVPPFPPLPIPAPCADLSFCAVRRGSAKAGVRGKKRLFIRLEQQQTSRQGSHPFDDAPHPTTLQIIPRPHHCLLPHSTSQT